MIMLCRNIGVSLNNNLLKLDNKTNILNGNTRGD